MRPSRSVPERPFPVAIAVGLTALGIGAMTGVGGLLAARSGLSLRGQIALGTLLLALPAVAALLVTPGRWPSVRGARALTRRSALLAALLGAALWLGSAGLLEVQSLVAPPPERYLDAFRALHRALAPRSPLDALVSILVIAVLPGVCEELVVRGVLLPALAARPVAGAARAGVPLVPVLLSALLFAAIHLDAYRFLFTLAIGLVLGVVRLATGSLWPGVVAHASLNTLTFALAPLVDDPSRPYTPSPVLGAACLVVGAALAWPLMAAIVDSPTPAP